MSILGSQSSLYVSDLLCLGLFSLQWRHNGRDSASNHQPHDCLLKHLFRRRSKKTSKLHVTGHCAGNSPGTGEFPAQLASNAENVSIWWRHHVFVIQQTLVCDNLHSIFDGVGVMCQEWSKHSQPSVIFLCNMIRTNNSPNNAYIYLRLFGNNTRWLPHICC